MQQKHTINVTCGLWLFKPREESSLPLLFLLIVIFILEGFFNFSHFCLQFFSFLNVVFFRLFYDNNITFRQIFVIIKCPAELNFDCKILIRSVPSTGVTGWLSRATYLVI